MSNPQNSNNQDLESSIIELLGYIKPIVGFLLKTIFIPILAAAAFAFYSNKQEKAKPKEYFASISFIKTSELNTSPSLLSVPTLNVGQGGGNSDNLALVILSDLILTKALFMPTSGEDGKLLINKMVDSFPEEFPDIEYYTIPEVDSFSYEQKLAFKRIVGKLKSDEFPLLTISKNDIYFITSKSTSDELALSIVENVYSATTAFYDESIVQKEGESVERIRRRRDSTLRLMQGYQSLLARTRTKSALDIQPTDMVDAARIESKMEVARAQYASFESNLQQIQLQVAETEPTFQKLNSPIKPLLSVPNNPKKATIVGAIKGFALGLFLALSLFAFLKFLHFYKKA